MPPLLGGGNNAESEIGGQAFADVDEEPGWISAFRVDCGWWPGFACRMRCSGAFSRRVGFFSTLFILSFSFQLGAQTPTPTLLMDRLADPGNDPPFRAIWDTIPSTRYELQRSHDLKQWSVVDGYPKEAAELSILQPVDPAGVSGFFRVRLLDEQGPEIVTRTPEADGFAVGRSADVSMTLKDFAGIDAASISLTVGGVGPLTAASPEIVFTDNTLIYQPGATPLGAFGETVTATLVVADTLGNSATHSWSFDLEVEPQVVSELLVFGSQQAQQMGQSVGDIPTAFLAGPRSAIAKQTTGDIWTLDSVQADRVILVYTGAAPTVPDGTYLCNQTPASVAEIFYRKVTSSSDDVANSRLILFTVDAALEEMVRQGSLAITENSVILSVGEGGAIQKAVAFDGLTEFDPLGFSLDGAKIGLRGRSNPTTGEFEHTGFSFNNVTVSSGGDFEWFSITAEELHWWLQPSIRASFDLGLTGLKRFKGVIRGDLESAIVLDAEVLLAGTKVQVELYDLPDNPARNPWVLIGVIGVPPAAIPVYAEIKFDLKVFGEAEAVAQVDFRAGIRQSASAEFGMGYERNRDPAVVWIRDLTFAPTEIVRPQVSLGGEVSLKMKLEPSVSFLVYGLAGVKAAIAPRGGIVVDAELLPSPHLAGRLEADVNLEFSPDGPALEWLDPKPKLSIQLWKDQWHLFPNEESLAFTKQPMDMTVFEGESVRLSGSVNRASDVRYQWRRNGAPIPRETRSYLDLLNVNQYHAGAYFVQATAGHETVNSAVATLTVDPRTQPAPAGMALIPAGPFEMGDTFNEGGSYERPVHTVDVSAFYMDQHEVTKAMWDDVYSWAVAHGYSFDNAGSGKAANHPVQTVNWYDVVKWCNARSEMEGRTPAYYTSAAKAAGSVYRTGQVSVQNGWVNWSAAYRLPTEAEWEKAARGPVSGQRFPWGNTITHSQANYFSSSSYSFDVSPSRGYHPTGNDGTHPYTSPAGTLAANGYGLYDMAGNVLEWCWDWYGSSYYSSSLRTDPQGPTSGSNRVVRGGSWNDYPRSSRTADRYSYSPVFRFNYLGFRTVLPPG